MSHSCITTSTGKTVDPFSIHLEDLDIVDIAHSLALTNRFYGHTAAPYSVAQHSVIVSSLCEPKDALAGLLHDASEAYLSDVATPIKQRPQMVGYRVAEAWAMEAVIERWGIVGDWEKAKAIDEKLCATEAYQLFRDPPAWACERERFDIKIEVMAWHEAERAFLLRFKELTERTIMVGDRIKATYGVGHVADIGKRGIGVRYPNDQTLYWHDPVRVFLADPAKMTGKAS